MNLKLIAGAVVSAALLASAAQAATITNNDAKPQTVKVYTADREDTITIMPSDTISVDHVCMGGCVLALENGDEFDVAATDELFLEEGVVFANPPAQGSGAPGQPQRQ